jgi:type 1 glutamine amidotransferase
MRRVVLILALAGLAVLPCWAPAAAETPAKIRVLLITGDDVAVHPWKEQAAATADALKAAGKFDVTVSEDLGVLDSADGLKPYGVIVLTRYNNKKLPLGDQAKQNLLDFVKGGKGFFVQHLASASFPKWDEFGKLCGRYWVMGKSGHGPRSVFQAKVADKNHPITRGIEDFKTDDELYAKLAGDVPIHVLVEADSPWSKKTEPLVFCLDYGKGRVVHNALGHDGKALATPAVRKIIARGVEWAATGKVSEEQ